MFKINLRNKNFASLFVQIYVPIMEANGEWYLMVASMDETVIYMVDTYLNSQQTTARKKSIRAIVCNYSLLGSIVFCI